MFDKLGGLIWRKQNINLKNREQDVATTSQEQRIISHLQAKGSMTEICIQNLLSIKRSRTLAIIKEMAQKGFIQVIGRGEGKKITLR